MPAYANMLAIARLVHVISAVLGGGLVVSLAIVAARSTAEKGLDAPLLARLARSASLGLGAMFVSGVAIDFASSGTFHHAWWFRIAGISMVVLGALVGVIRRRVTQVASGASEPTALRPVPSLAYAGCAVLVWITMLMELQPF
jgi:hypothetical protein